MKWTLPVVIAVAAGAWAGAEAPRYRVGDTVQNETFTTVDGQTLQLSQFQGKTLLLAFFTDG